MTEDEAREVVRLSLLREGVNPELVDAMMSRQQDAGYVGDYIDRVRSSVVRLEAAGYRVEKAAE